MHVYIYDEFLNKRKYDNFLAHLETRITDLGLNGKIIRLGNMQSSLSLLQNELKRGAKTIIAVGDSSTLNKALNTVVSHKTIEQASPDVPLGFIPTDKNNQIAECLGIKSTEEACSVLAARRIEPLDVAEIEMPDETKKYFLSNAIITTNQTVVEIDKKFSIEINEKGEIGIFSLVNNNFSNPQDGLAEVCVQARAGKFSKNNNQSIFKTKKLSIENPSHNLIIDDSVQINPPANINILKQKIHFIVGKKRSF